MGQLESSLHNTLERELCCPLYFIQLKKINLYQEGKNALICLAIITNRLAKC